MNNVVDETVDFGWWGLPYSWCGWLLQWRKADRRLHLVPAAEGEVPVNLGHYDIAEARQRLDGWASAGYWSFGGWLDSAWLKPKFPALPKWIELKAQQQRNAVADAKAHARPYDQDRDPAKLSLVVATDSPPTTADSDATGCVDAAAVGDDLGPFADPLMALREAAHVLAEPESTEMALDILRACRFAKVNIATLEREALKFLGDVLPTGTQEIDGYGPVTHRRSVAYTAWQHDELRPRLLRQIAQAHDGDLTMVEAVIDQWCRFTGKPSRYSTTALEAIGVQADEFASANWNSTVTIEKDR